MNSTFDTIAAVSTPFGKGGIAVIRISGADAIEICSKIFVPTSKKYPSLASVPARYAVYGEIMSCPEGFSGAERYVLDTGLATAHDFGFHTISLSAIILFSKLKPLIQSRSTLSPP